MEDVESAPPRLLRAPVVLQRCPQAAQFSLYTCHRGQSVGFFAFFFFFYPKVPTFLKFFVCVFTPASSAPQTGYERS